MVVEILSGVGLKGFQLLINSVGCKECRARFVDLLREKLKEVENDPDVAPGIAKATPV